MANSLKFYSNDAKEAASDMKESTFIKAIKVFIDLFFKIIVFRISSKPLQIPRLLWDKQQFLTGQKLGLNFSNTSTLRVSSS